MVSAGASEHWQERELFCRIRKSTGTQWDPHVAKGKFTRKHRVQGIFFFSRGIAAGLLVFSNPCGTQSFFFLSDKLTIAEGYPAHRIHEKPDFR